MSHRQYDVSPTMVEALKGFVTSDRLMDARVYAGGDSGPSFGLMKALEHRGYVRDCSEKGRVCFALTVSGLSLMNSDFMQEQIDPEKFKRMREANEKPPVISDEQKKLREQRKRH